MRAAAFMPRRNAVCMGTLTPTSAAARTVSASSDPVERSCAAGRKPAASRKPAGEASPRGAWPSS